MDRECRHQLPPSGTLTIDTAGNDELMGYWETRSGTYVLRGEVGYDQNTWTGRFEKPNDHSDFRDAMPRDPCRPETSGSEQYSSEVRSAV